MGTFECAGQPLTIVSTTGSSRVISVGASIAWDAYGEADIVRAVAPACLTRPRLAITEQGAGSA